MHTYDRLYIDGQWVSPLKGRSFETRDPSTESVITSVAAATAEDVDLAVRAARKAFDTGPWPRLSGAERALVLRRIAAGIRDQQQALAEIEVRDNGKPLPEALWDIGDTAGCFDFYAGLAEQLDANRERPVVLGDARFSSVARKEAIGVAGAIIPWNFPMLMAAWKVAPALAAGCTMVLKPSELTPLTALHLADIADQAGLPPGVLNVLTGFGADAGAPLSEHPGVDKLAFTGSVPTGSRIMQAAARDIKNISLELGGKSPFVIFDDADIERAVEWILFGIFWNQGEVCSATSRILVQRALYEPLLERLAQEAQRITIGNGLEHGVLLGPLVNRDQYDKVLQAIARGRAEGARLVSGGQRPPHLAHGYFVEPTVFADVPEDSWIWKEEIFGPVVCVRPFDTEDEAVSAANDSRFGLAAAVMSADLARCERVARSLRAGIVWINCSQPTFTEAPWGGYKQSGIGRELGEWGLNNYLEIKQITRFDSDQPWGWYIKPERKTP
ncbi:MAG: aldehyde dehydrogenase family protein [Zoogloeaceae bacterium]|nr:aldehyde dehydrogenase family protein [Zoogloeaceae bacterium]